MLRPKKLELEILDCENGYLVLEGNSMAHQHAFKRVMWVAKSPADLAELIKRLAEGTDVQQPV